jgi:hypothetical protein
LNFFRRYFHYLIIAADCDGSGKKIEKTLDSSSASTNGESFQHLGGKDEGGFAADIIGYLVG